MQDRPEVEPWTSVYPGQQHQFQLQCIERLLFPSHRHLSQNGQTSFITGNQLSGLSYRKRRLQASKRLDFSSLVPSFVVKIGNPSLSFGPRGALAAEMPLPLIKRVFSLPYCFQTKERH